MAKVCLPDLPWVRGSISQEDYLARAEDACRILEGKGRKDLFDGLREEMSEASEAMDFEKAASLRDILQNLEITLTPTRQFRRGRGVPTTVKPLEDRSRVRQPRSKPAPNPTPNSPH